ncbi:ROK family protein [Arcanobacterium bovis]|uniref:ROK family protein n=1 Tax=Arcanobacterium bovis TaxID=2529275 RepID=A0A4Q9V1B4_9ACTO|nr:ROK family protein [Arcanobacterium bovis]TBW21546.1 ROK family protein [Arcanobacterium bovis]
MDSVIALDIGGTKIGWGIVEFSQAVEVADQAGQTRLPMLNIVERGSIPTEALSGGAIVAQRIVSLVNELYEANPQVTGVAIASAGVVDPNTGSIRSATNTMPGWGGTELAKLISQSVHLPVRVLNDVHAHGLGEARLGAGRGHDSTLSVAVGTGIGGAMIDAGQVQYGAHFLAGHVGHIHHHYAAGMQCSCGRIGHIEAICSGSGITAWYNARLARLREHINTSELSSEVAPAADTASSATPVSNGRELQDRADQGDELARACFNESAFALGEAIASLANSIDPSVIVLSGSMTRSGEQWWAGVREGFANCAMDAVQSTPILLGDLGSDAPLLGAVLNFLRD